MEDLRESVYECSTAIEAHMVCDLLARAGISSRVDGEFLQGAGGEPLGSLVRVRVDPARAPEAREVISDWERQQAAISPTPPLESGGSQTFRSVAWFFAGVCVGGFVLYLALNTPVTIEGTDLNGDGTLDDRTFYAGIKMERWESDRNFDGRTDVIWKYDRHGVVHSASYDDDFDGRFEWEWDAEGGRVKESKRDRDGDGKSEIVTRFQHEVMASTEYFAGVPPRIVKREHFVHGRLNWAEFDADGDGAFERRVDFDEKGDERRVP